MSPIGLITIHGMGDTKEKYAKPLFKDLKGRIGAQKWGQVFTHSIYYQNILQDNQEEYYGRVREKLDWLKLRQFVLYGFCDAASLETQKEGYLSPYFIAQTRILNAFQEVYKEIGPDAPVIIVAQSLGGQVMSNYLWDALRSTPPQFGVFSAPPAFGSQGEEDFCRGKTINRLFTTGCNIPIFVAGRSRDKIFSIEKPNASFEWHNFYDEDDVLGWPLRELSDGYSALVKDHKITSGFLTGGTPLSHVNYWGDRDFLRPVVRHINRVIR